MGRMIDLRQSEKYAEHMERFGWRVEEKHGLKAYIKPLPLLPFSVMKLQRVEVEKIDFSWLKAVSRKYRVVKSYVEMDETVNSLENGESFSKVFRKMKQEGYKPSSSPMLPTKTRLVDLRMSEEELLKQMKKKTRYNIGKAVRNGLSTQILTGKELVADKKSFNSFYLLLKRNAQRVGMFKVQREQLQSQLKAFGEEAYVVLVGHGTDQFIGEAEERGERVDGQLLAGAVYWSNKELMEYSHNGSTAAGRKLQAPTLAIWEGMQEAKRRGIERFDFGGVYDERFPLKRWRGFSRFKRGFGGTARYYPPVFERLLPGR